MSTARDRAVSGLTFYIKKAWDEAGLQFGGDNYAEVAGIVDDIVTAADSLSGIKARKIVDQAY